MSESSAKPSFSGGRNIAIKVPPHEWEQTVAFYRDILRLPVIDNLPSATETVAFQFGSNRLWVDRVETLSQAETRLISPTWSLAIMFSPYGARFTSTLLR